MKLQDLFEANIPVRDIERAARAAIIPLMKNHLQELWDQYLERFPDITSKEDWSEDRYDLYDDFRSNLMSHSETFINGILWQPCRVLSKLASERANERVRVVIECRQFSKDTTTARGYFTIERGIGYLIKCFVEELDVREAATEALHEMIFGEAYDDGMDQLANRVVSVFVHEFVHLEQELRNPQKPHLHGLVNDPGITTVGGGKRGDRRNPRGGDIGWARYTGSLNEIESFASQTAVDMVGAIKVRYPSTEPEDDQINEILTDLALGWGSGTAFHAMSHMKTYWDQFQEAGVKASERDRVWKRYMKLTYQKIWQWRREKLGKTESFRIGRMKKDHPVWVDLAKKGMVACANQIAYDVAFQCYFEVSEYYTVEKIAALNPLAQQGVSFMENYFFGGYDNTAVESMKVSVSMQKLIAKKINQLAAENKYQAA